MGALFSRKRVYWVPANKKIADKIQRVADWKNSEDFSGWQMQNDPKCAELILKFDICENLVEVILSFNGLGDEECTAIAKALKGSKTLKRIDLSNNHIHSSGAQKIADSLTPKSGESDPSLEELNMRNNAVGSEGAQSLAIVLSCNKNLKKLLLYWNNIRNKGLRAVIDNLPPAPLPPDYCVDVRYNGFDTSDPSAGNDAGGAEDDCWEVLEEKLKKSKLSYSSDVPEEDRQFLGWPLDD